MYIVCILAYADFHTLTAITVHIALPRKFFSSRYEIPITIKGCVRVSVCVCVCHGTSFHHFNEIASAAKLKNQISFPDFNLIILNEFNYIGEHG